MDCKARERETSNNVKSVPQVMFETIPVALSIPISRLMQHLLIESFLLNIKVWHDDDVSARNCIKIVLCLKYQKCIYSRSYMADHMVIFSIPNIIRVVSLTWLKNTKSIYKHMLQVSTILIMGFLTFLITN